MTCRHTAGVPDFDCGCGVLGFDKFERCLAWKPQHMLIMALEYSLRLHVPACTPTVAYVLAVQLITGHVSPIGSPTHILATNSGKIMTRSCWCCWCCCPCPCLLHHAQPHPPQTSTYTTSYSSCQTDHMQSCSNEHPRQHHSRVVGARKSPPAVPPRFLSPAPAALEQLYAPGRYIHGLWHRLLQRSWSKASSRHVAVCCMMAAWVWRQQSALHSGCAAICMPCHRGAGYDSVFSYARVHSDNMHATPPAAQGALHHHQVVPVCAFGVCLHLWVMTYTAPLLVRWGSLCSLTSSIHQGPHGCYAPAAC